MQGFHQYATDSWLKFLHPETLRSNLISASLYLAAWETLKSAAIEPLHDFFSLDETNPRVREKYKNEVLSRHKSPFRASLLWFQEMGAIDNSDLALVDRLLQHRNDIAHKLPEFLTTANREVDLKLFTSLNELVCKIDRWWFREMELSIYCIAYDRDIDEVDVDAVVLGRMLMLGLMYQIATGDDSDAVKWYEGFVAFTNQVRQSSKERSDHEL